MDIRQFLLILKARWLAILAILILTAGTTLAISLYLPKMYTATASLVVDVKGTDPVGGMTLPGAMMPGYMATQIDIITSQKVGLKVVRDLKLAQNPMARKQFEDDTGGAGSMEHWLADLLLRKVKVKPARESSVINIAYEAVDPRFAAVIANTFAQAYIDTNLELRVEPARQTAAWFDGQIKTLRDNLEAAQAKLSKYQRDTGIISADERLDVESGRLTELSTQLVVAQGVTFDSQNRERKAQELIARGASPDELVEVLNQPVIISLKSDISRSEARIQELSSQFGKNHPQFQQAVAQVEELKRKLVSEIENVTRALGNSNTVNKRRELEIASSLEAQKRKVLEIKRQRDEITVLAREVDGAHRAFDAAMARLTQTSLEGQSKQTNVAVLNPAIPPATHSSPKLVLNMVLAFFLGTMLGIGFALMLELLNRRVRSVADLKSMFDFPVLGVISGKRIRRNRFSTRRRSQPAVTGQYAPASTAAH